MKRSNEGELATEIKSVSKKLIDNMEFSEIHESMSKLSNILLDSINNKKYIDEFNEFKDAIPGLVVWGNQSTGKSSLLKRMFPLLSQKVCEGLGTQCPIELKCSVSYKKNDIYLVDGNNVRYDGDDIKHSIAKAEERMNEFFKNTTHIDGKIVIEIAHSFLNLTITDLPGCITNNDVYFNKMKHRYLNRPGNIIIYVARGDVDPDSDMSLNFLAETKNEKICVLTHTDYWKHDLAKEKYLEKYIKLANNVFLVNNKVNDELDYLQKYMNNDQVILGTDNLKNHLNTRLTSKLSEMLPTLCLKINALHNTTNNKLNEKGIGVAPITKTDLCTDYISYLSEQINEKLNSYGTKNTITDPLLRKALIESIQKCFDINVPQPNILVCEIRDSNEIIGWDIIFSKYLDSMAKSTFASLSKLVDDHFDNISQKLSCINYGYLSRTKNQEKIIKSNITPLITSANENAKNALCALIYKIMKNNKDKKYMDTYQKEIIDLRLIEYSQALTKNCSSVLQIKSLNVYPDTKELIRKDIIRESSCDPILIEAKEQYIKLKHIWNHKCEAIIDIFCHPITQYVNVLKDDVMKMIRDIKDENIDDESTESIMFRDNLLKIEQTCRELKEKINCYSSPALEEILKNYS